MLFWNPPASTSFYQSIYRVSILWIVTFLPWKLNNLILYFAVRIFLSRQDGYRQIVPCLHERFCYFMVKLNGPLVAVQEFPTYLIQSFFNMFIVAHHQLLPGIKYVRVKLPNINFLLRNGCMKHQRSVPIRHNSHITALLYRKGSQSYSQLKLQYKNLIQNSCHPRCIPPHARGLVTPVSWLDENMAVIKDQSRHEYANPDMSDEKKADSSNLKHHGIQKTYHTPVMVKEVLEALQPVNGQV